MSNCRYCNTPIPRAAGRATDIADAEFCSNICLDISIEKYADYVRRCVLDGFENIPFVVWLDDR